MHAYDDCCVLICVYVYVLRIIIVLVHACREYDTSDDNNNGGDGEQKVSILPNGRIVKIDLSDEGNMHMPIMTHVQHVAAVLVS
jgi:hypothetical protein